MSFLIKSPKLSSAGAGAMPATSYREAEPMPLGYGRGKPQTHWLSDAFNWREAAAGKNEPAHQYASIAFSLGAGPIDGVGIMKQDGKLGWDFGYTFAPGEDYKDFTFNASLPGGYAWTVRIYRGSETQTADSYLVAGTGQDHPARRGQAYAVMHNIYLGKGVTTIPTFEIETIRNAPVIGSDLGAGSAYGVNPIAAIYGFLLEGRGGDVNASLLDATHWGNQANALWSTGINQRTGELTFLNPWFSGATSLADAVSQILAYFDGYLYVDGGKLKVGWFPGGAPSGTLPTIAEQDLEAKPSGPGFPDWNRGATSIAVVFTDAQRNYEDGSAIYRAPANRELGVAAAPSRKDRPFAHFSDQAHAMAAELANGDTDDTGVTLQVLKSRAVRLDSTPLIPGDIFTWAYGPHGLSLACRVVARRIRAGAASDMLQVVRERGAFPKPYTPTVDAPLPYVAVPPVDIANYRFWFMPSGFGGGRQITCLVDRPAAQNLETRLHLSANGSAPWTEILTLSAFAAKATLDAGGLTIGASTVRVASSSLDWARMQAQSSIDQADDTLLLLIDNEVFSVGSITVVSAGVYDLGILRARQGTVAAAHTGSVGAWLFYYEELRTVTHAEFYRVRTAGVYDSSLATKRFKLQAVSADTVNTALPADPGIPFVLPDLTEADSAGVRTFRTPTAPTGDLRVGDIWYQTSGTDVIGSYRWNGSAWEDITDKRIADNDAAVRALIAEVGKDVAVFLANAADHANALLQETVRRQAQDGTLQGNINDNYATFVAADQAQTNANEALARDLVAMTAHFNDSVASLFQEFQVRAAAQSAQALSISTLSSSVGTLTSTVNVMAAAYVVGGVAIATWGFKLDGGGKVVGMQAIAASGGTQAETGVIVFSGADLRSDNFVAGTSGWRIKYDGSVEFQDAVIRGTIKAGTTIEGLTPAPMPNFSNGGSPNITVSAPTGGAPSGYKVSYRIAGGQTVGPASSFPFTVTTGGVNNVVEFIATATGRLPATEAWSWNGLFL